MKKYLFTLLALASLSAVWMCACTSSNDETANEEEEEEIVEEVVTYYKNPVINRDAPDPTVVRGKDGKFYAFSTMQNGNVPVYQSTNLADWEYYGEAYAPAKVPKFVPNAGIWAPMQITLREDMYYISRCQLGVANGRQVLAVQQQ